MFKTVEQFHREQFERIKVPVLEHYKVTFEEIMVPSRSAIFSRPRQVLAYLSYTLIDKITQDEIIDFMGCKERSTISKGIKEIGNMIDTNKGFANTIEGIKSKIAYE